MKEPNNFDLHQISDADLIREVTRRKLINNRVSRISVDECIAGYCSVCEYENDDNSCEPVCFIHAENGELVTLCFNCAEAISELVLEYRKESAK